MLAIDFADVLHAADILRVNLPSQSDFVENNSSRCGSFPKPSSGTSVQRCLPQELRNNGVAVFELFGTVRLAPASFSGW
jgi:hypothetical protein